VDLLTLVILGTQDKVFPRLLKEIEKQIKKGNLQGEVIVQAGSTKFKSKYMKIFDLIPMGEFDKLIKQSDLIITHGGVGTILSALRQNKKVIVVPRLKKYEEHENDHQIQITQEFARLGYILPCYDTKDMSEVLEQVNDFKPKKYKSNNKKMIQLIENYIDNL
jgi:UDP-N-acetylglucosamine transferase subunit ALG13